MRAFQVDETDAGEGGFTGEVGNPPVTAYLPKACFHLVNLATAPHPLGAQARLRPHT